MSVVVHVAGILSVIRKRLLILLLALLLSGCSVLGPRLEAPTLSVAKVELIKGDLFEQRLRARMRVQNPNDRELRVRGVTYTIELGGEELGRGLSGSSFVIPARGEAEFDMLVTANLAGTLLKLLERAGEKGRAPNEIEYALRGEVKLDSGFIRTVPFNEKGRLPLR